MTEAETAVAVTPATWSGGSSWPVEAVASAEAWPSGAAVRVAMTLMK